MKSEEPLHGKDEYDIARWARTIRLVEGMILGLLSVLGIKSGILAEKMASSYPAVAGALARGNYAGLTQTISSATGSKVVAPVFARWELALASFVYHYGGPAFQFAAAVVFNYAWQYYWHRTFRRNKWLFGGLPSRAFGPRINMVPQATWRQCPQGPSPHIRAVPYCFAALYSPPVETIIEDIIGVSLSFAVTGLTTRQAMWFLLLSTLRSIDDHCGYALPFDPFRYITSLNAKYHDVHHQSWEMKVGFHVWKIQQNLMGSSDSLASVLPSLNL